MLRYKPLLAMVLLLCVGLAGRAAAATAEKPPRPKEDYYELYKILADTIDQVDRNYVKEVDRRELIEAAVKGVLSKLDPYSVYITPDELDHFRTSVDNEFGGIGIQIGSEDGEITVLSPMYGTPAYRAGILAGDRIVEINGKPCDGLTLDEAIARLKGKEGTSLALTVIHAGKSNRVKLSVRRERIHVETVLGDSRNPDDSWNYLVDPERGIAYVRVTAFGRDTFSELQKAMHELQAKKFRALVLDLRFNPGGLLSAAIEVSGLYVSQGRIVSVKGRNTPERVWDAHKEGAMEGFPMVVLVNHYSASASEIVSACLQDHKRAVIMGERTWGKGSVQNVIELEDGRSALKLTTAAYCRPSGKNIHRFPDSKEEDAWGVTPDPGYDLRITDSEMASLLIDRHNRDVIRPHPRSAPPAERPAASAPKPADGQQASLGTPGDMLAIAATNPPAVHETKSGHADHGEAAVAAKAGPPVDRQLQMALTYLRGELAQKK